MLFTFIDPNYYKVKVVYLVMGPRLKLSGSGYRKKAEAKAIKYASLMEKTLILFFHKLRRRCSPMLS